MRCCMNNSVLLIALASSSLVDNQVASFAPPHRGVEVERPLHRSSNTRNAFVRHRRPLQMANSGGGYDFSGPPPEPSVEERLKQIQARRAKILEEIAAAEADSKRLGEQLKDTTSKVEDEKQREEEKEEKEEERRSTSESKLQPPTPTPQASPPKMTNLDAEGPSAKVTPKADVPTSKFAPKNDGDDNGNETKFSFRSRSIDKPPADTSAPTTGTSLIPKMDDVVGDSTTTGTGTGTGMDMDLSGITGPASIFGGFVVAAVAARSMLQSRDEVQDEMKEDMEKKTASKSTSTPPPIQGEYEWDSEKGAKDKVPVQKKKQQQEEKETMQEPQVKKDEGAAEEPEKVLGDNLDVAVEVALAKTAKAAASVSKPLESEATTTTTTNAAKGSALFNRAIVTEEIVGEATTPTPMPAMDTTGSDDPTAPSRLSRFRSYFTKKEEQLSDGGEDADTAEVDITSTAKDDALEVAPDSISATENVVEETVNAEGEASADDLEVKSSSAVIDDTLSEGVNGSAITNDAAAEDVPMPMPEPSVEEEQTPMTDSISSMNEGVNGVEPVNGSEPIKMELDTTTELEVDVELESVAAESAALETGYEEQVGDGGVASASPLFAKSDIEDKPSTTSTTATTSTTNVVDAENLSTTLFPKKTTPSVVPKTPGDIINAEIPPGILDDEPSMYDFDFDTTVGMGGGVDGDDEDDRLETFTKVFCEVNDLLQKKKRIKDKDSKKDEQ